MSSVAATVEISHARYLAVGNTLEFKMYMSGGGALMGVSPGEDMQIIRLA